MAYGSGEGPISRYWIRDFVWCVQALLKVLCVICPSIEEDPFLWCVWVLEKVLSCVQVLEKVLCLMYPSTTESTNWISSTSTCRTVVCHSSAAVDSILVDCDVLQFGEHLSRDDDEAAWISSADLLSGILLQTTPLTSYTNCPRLLVAMGATVALHDIRFAQHLQAVCPHYGQLRVSST